MANFQDPYGAVTRKKMCMFKRCMCVDQNGDRRVCVPPKPGWMCERMACLLKMDICLEREKAERERVKRELAAIEAALEAGKEMAKDYCESDEGKKYFYDLARKKANDVVDARRKQRWANSTDKKLVAKMEELQKKYEFKRKHLQANRDAAEDRLREKRTRLEEEADELEGYAREVKENEVDAVMDEIAEIPEQQELDELEKGASNWLDRASNWLDRSPCRAYMYLTTRLVPCRACLICTSVPYRVSPPPVRAQRGPRQDRGNVDG